MAEFFDLKLLISPFPFESKPTIFGSLMLKIDFSIGLCKIEQSKGMIFFNLFKVISTLVVKVELPSIALVGSVMIRVDSRTLLASLIDFICLAQATKTSIKVFSVNEAES